MRLRLTVALPPDSALHEVEVEAPEGTTAREVGRALGLHLARDGDLALAARGVRLADDAPLGSAPLVDGASVVLAPRSAADPSAAQRAGHRPRPPVVLSVAHGPDAGRSHDLTPGTHRVGRSCEAEVMVGDDRLSRLHLEVRSDGDGVTVRDLRSTNGARLAGTAIGTTPVPWTAGATLTIGHTELALRAAIDVPATSRPQPDGTRLVNRQPRVVPSPTSETVTMPQAPAPPSRPRIPWVAVLAPLPLALLMAVFLGPVTLAFALMSPVLMAANLVGERLHGSRRHATQQAEYERALAEARARVEALCVAEEQARRRATPDPAEILAIATGPSARLWERRRNDPDALAVTVGTCTSPAGVHVVGPPGAGPVEPPTVKGVPCVVRLGAVGVLSLCGPRTAITGAARAVLGQLLTLHSPVDLQLVVLSAARRAEDWQWLSRVPHPGAAGAAGWSAAGAAPGPAAGDLGQDEALVLSLVDQLVRTAVQRGDGDGHGPHIVVLLDGAAALRTVPGMSTVLQQGPAVGISVLALDSVATALPSETGALLDLTDPNQPSLRLPGHEHQQFVTDGVGAWWADRLSRGLAPLRDATPSDHGALPSAVPLLSLLPGADDAQVVAALWQEPPRAAVPIGVTAQGPWVLDLAADGPHVLVAGTTGSGKSELLRTLVVSLSIHHRPEDLSFVLVDYKGGAAFRDCERLPHTAGVITDLDEHLAQRALTSLRAELKRRERLFASVGATDFASYQRHSAVNPALPRLVVVIDEFRALAEELPEFVDGIVSIAALGRSLGLHVVLATQRPAGVVTADIKANVNLRIALRVRDSTDSQDVLDSPAAATVDPAVPGRGYARSGGSGLVGFHAARLSAVGQPTGIRVRDVVWGRSQPPWPTAEGSGDETPERIVTAVVDAAAMLGAAPAPPVWLPPLPLQVPFASLPSPSGPECCVIGLVDRPELHAQAPLELDLATPGHWSFVGAGSSGRTTALVTVARGLASRLGADRLHVYAVSGGSLVGLTDLPQCGAHVDVADLGRLERLVDRLEAEIHSRQRNVGPERARLLLLVDDCDLLARWGWLARPHHGRRTPVGTPSRGRGAWVDGRRGRRPFAAARTRRVRHLSTRAPSARRPCGCGTGGTGRHRLARRRSARAWGAPGRHRGPARRGTRRTGDAGGGRAEQRPRTTRPVADTCRGPGPALTRPRHRTAGRSRRRRGGAAGPARGERRPPLAGGRRPQHAECRAHCCCSLRAW